MAEHNGKLQDWQSLDADEQVTMRVEYVHYLDSLPPTCSLDTRIERFAPDPVGTALAANYAGTEYND